MLYRSSFFFFQAEDGIRDIGVTGVQTCALPISALAAGMTPATMVDDEPLELDQGDGSVWSPRNFNDQYAGYVTLRTALTRSANSATVRVSRQVGEARVVSVARRNGITSPLQPVPAIALGALEVTPVELVTAYAPFANGGLRASPRPVRRS